MNISQMIPILSLLVAALAVFVGPIVTILVTRQKNETDLKISNKQLIAPIRQSWINNLRDLIAEISGKSSHYFVSGYEERSDNEYMHIQERVHKLELYLNPLEDDHLNLLKNAREMVFSLSSNSCPENDKKFWDSHLAVMAMSKNILKREWERVKDEI